MSIVLKENDWARERILARTLDKKPTETLRRVARYYLDEGFSPSVTRKKLESFLIQCDPTASLVKWSDGLDHAISYAKKYQAVEIESIPVTRQEMERIDSLSGKQIQRLAFTLLCLAKYWIAIRPECDGWVSNKDNEIMLLANVKTSIKRQSFMYYTLRESGMLQFSKKVDNTNVRVCFISDDEPVLEVKDFRNLGYQYHMYHGEPYFECDNCGIVTKIAVPGVGRKQKYCKECAAEIAVQQTVNSHMRPISYIETEKENNHENYQIFQHEQPVLQEQREQS